MSSSLEHLRVLFEGLGFGVRENAYFGPAGLMVFKQPVGTDVGSGEIRISEAWVFVYPKDAAWELRVTKHGGPHWVRRASTAREIETLALEVLEDGHQRWVPSEGWLTAEEFR